MGKRTGEKLGWWGGWVGSFLWLVILGGVWLAKGRTGLGLAALGFFAVAMAVVFLATPWRFPRTRYWKLFLPLFLLVVVAVAMCIAWGEGELKVHGMNWFGLLWLLCLTPMFVTAGRRRWTDGDPKPPA